MSAAQVLSSVPGNVFATADLIGSKVPAKDAAATREMASEFEAMFLSLLLKEMRQALEPGGLFPGDTGDVQGGLFDLYMSKHLADGGGVGLAAALERQIHQDATANVLRPTASLRPLPESPGS
jgi:peptidoglycan hydrolase FlgJ